MLTLSRPGFFLSSCGQGHVVPPSENHVPPITIPYCLVFLKACPKLDDMTYFSFHGTVSSVLRWLKGIFLQKLQTKETVQIALVLVFNESVNTKTPLYTYLRLNLNRNFEACAYVKVLRDYSIAHCYRQSRQSWAVAITRIKSFE